MPTLLVVSTDTHAPVHVRLGTVRETGLRFQGRKLGVTRGGRGSVTPSTAHYTHIKYSSRVPAQPRTFGNWGIV